MSRIRSFSRPAPAVAFAVAMAIGASAYAAEPAEESLEEVIVTGTRRAGMSVEDSPAPVQVLAADALARTAAPDLMNSIANAIPSYNAQQVGGDMESQTLSAGLRALSPNHTLTLVNGKRRHITSNVGAYTGAAGADLSFIPSAAIDHVEVLTDGAAALYGSDAIAGVINIILKDDFHGGSLSAGYGGYTDGGGGTTNVAGSIGFGTEDAYFFLAGEVEDRQSAYRFSTVSYAQCWVNRAACEADELNNNGYMYSFTAGD